MTTTPTLDQLKRALAISEQIAALQAELAAVLNGAAPTPATKAAPTTGDGRKGKRSSATIAKMKASQQARWAKIKSPAAAKAEAPVKKKGGMSAAGRAAIVAAQKARWAKIKAAKAPVASKAPAAVKADALAKEKGKISTETKRWTYTKAGK